MTPPFSAGARIRTLSAALVTAIAFGCYRATLLPGLDLGDTASFQAVVGSLTLTPRQAYPLYYAIGNLFLWLSAQEPAHALNLASAVCGSLASGITVWVAATLTESVGAGIFAGLLLASSYTFWSQSIIAEVYALHLLMAVTSLAALLAWSARPTLARLSLFFAVYALGFGNHLSTILLLPGFALFLLFGSGQGPRAVLQGRVVALALGLAAVGSLQYLWNFRGLWHVGLPPANLKEALATFWLDVTKADWRASLVLGVSETGLRDRPDMYWFDIHQQFGALGVSAALLGAGYLLWTRTMLGILVATIYAANVLFALTYNVGDTHVFFLPSHLAVALFAAGGVKGLQLLAARRMPLRSAATLMACLCVLYPLWRVVDTFPAVDRSSDRRPEELLDGLTKDLTSQNAVLAADLNWQLQNALDYYAKYRRPDLPWFLTADVLPRFRAFAQDNAAIDRQVVVTPLALQNIVSAYGRAFEAEPDPRVRAPTLTETIAFLPSGTPYALAVLKPYREFPIDERDLFAASLSLSGGRIQRSPEYNYDVMVGAVGDRPALLVGSDRPFRLQTSLHGLRIDVRMESWLPTDTIRRAGFGHVIVNHRHALTLERGISFVALDGEGRALLTAYAGGLFAPQPRYILHAGR